MPGHPPMKVWMMDCRGNTPLANALSDTASTTIIPDTTATVGSSLGQRGGQYNAPGVGVAWRRGRLLWEIPAGKEPINYKSRGCGKEVEDWEGRTSTVRQPF